MLRLDCSDRKLALAGLPGTSGFIGKLFLIEATVEADYTWLGVAIVIGTMVSLAYYLRVLAAVWMRPEGPPVQAPLPAIAGGAPLSPLGGNEPGAADVTFSKPPPGGPLGASRCALVVGAGVICAAATVAFGVYPDPLVDWATNAAESLSTTL